MIFTIDYRIDSVKKEDKGMYQCFIRNDQESAGASAELKLGGRCKYKFIKFISLIYNFNNFIFY